MIAMASWLITSALGRMILYGVLTVGTLGLITWAIFKKGVDAEKLKQAAKNLEHLKERIKTDEEITSLSPDARRERLREWAR